MSSESSELIFATKGLSSARRVALVLHSLNDADQAWFLEHLASHRTLLEPLIQQLQVNRLPRDFKLAHELITKSPKNKGEIDLLHEVGTTETANVEQKFSLERAPALQVFGALKQEPLALVGRLFAVQVWLWGPAVLAMFQPSQRREIERLSRQDYPALILHSIQAAAAKQVENLTMIQQPASTSRINRVLLLLRSTFMKQWRFS